MSFKEYKTYMLWTNNMFMYGNIIYNYEMFWED